MTGIAVSLKTSADRFGDALACEAGPQFARAVLAGLPTESDHPLLSRLASEVPYAQARQWVVDYARLCGLALDGQIMNIEQILARVPSAVQRQWALGQMLRAAGVGMPATSDLDCLRRLSHGLDSSNGRETTNDVGPAFRNARKQLNALYSSDRPGVALATLMAEAAAWPRLAQSYARMAEHAPWMKPGLRDAFATLSADRLGDAATEAALCEIGAKPAGRRAFVFGLTQAMDLVHAVWSVLERRAALA